MFGYHVRSLTISDGTEVQIPERGVVVFVGPNNAGKSLALRELAQNITTNPVPPPNGPPPPKVVVGVEAEKVGSADDLRSWLDEHAHRREPTPGEPWVMYRRHGNRASAPSLDESWSYGHHHLGALAPFLTMSLGADGRSGMTSSVGLYDLMNDEPSSPLQVLFANPALATELSNACLEAFGTPLFVNGWTGTQIHLQMGELAVQPTFPPSAELIDELRRHPHVSEQGDGLRGFLGIMLTVIAARYPVVMIDEPEAFLHPPQALLLGRKLSTLVPQGTQIFLATHSTDLLVGLLESPDLPVTVVRLTREQAVNSTAVLPHESVRTIWSDPLLRHSNVLDGLFHRGVVVCEADADAIFYNAALDSHLSQSGLPASNLQFVQVGGKDQIYKAVQALVAASVPVRAVADFDVLRDVPTLKKLVGSLGGVWEPIWELQRKLDADISSKVNAPSLSAVREAVLEVLDSVAPAIKLTKEAAEQVRRLVKVETGWEQVKVAGMASLSGDTYTRAVNLLDRLADIGLFVVPVGELERWYPPAAGLHGPAWASRALTENAHLLDGPQRFVERLYGSF
jgi:hypothetical protein